MTDETFENNLLRFISAELFFLISMQASREMYGKSYFSLGVVEKANVDQMVASTVGGNFSGLTPEKLRTSPPQNPIGFEGPKADGKKQS